LLLRSNLARQQLPGLLPDLTTAWGRAIAPDDFGPLEVADHARALLRPRYLAARAQARVPHFSRWAEPNLAPLTHGLAAFGTALEGIDLCYVPIAWDFLGLLPIVPERDLARMGAVARACTEECFVSSMTGEEGIALEYHAVDAEHGEPCPYELVIWGARWQSLARATLPFDLACRGRGDPSVEP